MPSGLGPGGLVLRVALEFFCRARRSGWFLLGGGDLLNHFFWYGSGGVFRSSVMRWVHYFCATTARTTESRRTARGDGCYSRR